MKKIKVGKEEVELDDKFLDVSPDNINEFLSKHSAVHNNIQTKLSDASYILRKLNDNYDFVLNNKFKHYKSQGKTSDKMAEACAESDPEVVAAQDKVRTAEYVKDELYGFLKSMDYAHDNALQICYNLRKEMDTISKSSVKKIDHEELVGIFKK